MPTSLPPMCMNLNGNDVREIIDLLLQIGGDEYIPAGKYFEVYNNSCIGHIIIIFCEYKEG